MLGTSGDTDADRLLQKRPIPLFSPCAKVGDADEQPPNASLRFTYFPCTCGRAKKSNFTTKTEERPA